MEEILARFADALHKAIGTGRGDHAFSPCGRRWPERPDEGGITGVRRPSRSSSTPHPPLRGTFSRKGRREAAFGKILATAVLASAVCGCWGPPQIGGDDASFKAVDALYTAVSLREVKLVDQCQTTLKSLHEAGSLGEDVSQSLESIIVEAKGGAWEDAQTRLARFMEGQRRGR